MKKFLGIAFSLLLAGIIGSTTLADCKELDFDNGTVCIDIVDDGTNRFQLETDIYNTNGGSISILCDIMLPNGDLISVSENDCQGDFYYDDSDEWEISIYVRFQDEYDILRESYNFDNTEWSDDNNNNSDENLDGADKFDVDVDDTTPDKNIQIDITLEAPKSTAIILIAIAILK